MRAWCSVGERFAAVVVVVVLRCVEEVDVDIERFVLREGDVIVVSEAAVLVLLLVLLVRRWAASFLASRDVLILSMPRATAVTRRAAIAWLLAVSGGVGGRIVWDGIGARGSGTCLYWVLTSAEMDLVCASFEDG